MMLKMSEEIVSLIILSLLSFPSHLLLQLQIYVSSSILFSIRHMQINEQIKLANDLTKTCLFTVLFIEMRLKT